MIEQKEKGSCVEALVQALELRETLRRFRILVVLAAFLCLSISTIGLIGLGSSHSIPLLPLAYTSGLSMALLPSTFPAVLAIIPLTLRKGYRKGLLLSLLFGLGLATTMAFYGFAAALLGKILYLDQVTLLMWFLAGTMAYCFGLVELGLFRFEPGALGDGLVAFLMGLLLGNAGISCPNPAFYDLLRSIVGSGSPFIGAASGFVHGLGKATPLIGLAFLGLLAVTAMGWVRTRREVVGRVSGWGWIAIASLLLPKPLLGHTWWEASSIHRLWNDFVESILSPMLAESALIQAELGGLPSSEPLAFYLPWAVFLILIAIPLVLGWWKARLLTKEEER